MSRVPRSAVKMLDEWLPIGEIDATALELVDWQQRSDWAQLPLVVDLDVCQNVGCGLPLPRLPGDRAVEAHGRAQRRRDARVRAARREAVPAARGRLRARVRGVQTGTPVRLHTLSRISYTF